MPLTFELKSEPNLPLDVRSLTPDQLAGLSSEEVLNREVGFGNRQASVRDWFSVSGDLSDCELVFNGPLQNVHSIGHLMSDGKISLNGPAGRHVGALMSGGEIVVRGDVSDYAGYEMTGGTIVVHGNAGDHVGGCFPGAKFGMNRGTILIAGSAGKGLGYRMRRGTIVVGGDVGDHTAWQMRAGTIVVFGKCDGSPGIDMKRGTILVGELANASGSFVETTNDCEKVVSLLGRWLKGVCSKHDLKFPALEVSSSRKAWCGDVLTGSRGELVVLGDCSGKA